MQSKALRRRSDWEREEAGWVTAGSGSLPVPLVLSHKTFAPDPWGIATKAVPESLRSLCNSAIWLVFPSMLLITRGSKMSP